MSSALVGILVLGAMVFVEMLIALVSDKGNFEKRYLYNDKKKD